MRSALISDHCDDGDKLPKRHTGAIFSLNGGMVMLNRYLRNRHSNTIDKLRCPPTGSPKRTNSFVGLPSMFFSAIQPHPACLMRFVLTLPKRWHERDLIYDFGFSHCCDAGLAETPGSPWLLSTHQLPCPPILYLLRVIRGNTSIDTPTPIHVPAEETLGSTSVPGTLTIASTAHTHLKRHETTSLKTFVQIQNKIRTRTV